MSLAGGNKVSSVLVKILYPSIGLVADVRVRFGDTVYLSNGYR